MPNKEPEYYRGFTSIFCGSSDEESTLFVYLVDLFNRLFRSRGGPASTGRYQKHNQECDQNKPQIPVLHYFLLELNNNQLIFLLFSKTTISYALFA